MWTTIAMIAAYLLSRANNGQSAAQLAALGKFAKLGEMGVKWGLEHLTAPNQGTIGGVDPQATFFGSNGGS